MEVMVGGTHGYIFALFMPLYLFISLSVLISLLQLFFFSFFAETFNNQDCEAQLDVSPLVEGEKKEPDMKAK